MAWGTLTAWLLAAMVRGGDAAPARANAGLLLRVYDVAGIGDRRIGEAMMITGRLLGRAGVASRWVLCRIPGPGEPRANGPCWQDPEPLDLYVRLLPGVSPVAAGICGEAIFPTAQPGRLATIYEGCVASTSDRSVVPAPTVLAICIAHELGHLLLSRPGHATHGIMATVLSTPEWQRALAGALWFTRAEASGLRAGVLARAALTTETREDR